MIFVLIFYFLFPLLQVYGIDFWGRDVVRGYGSALVPLAAGNHVIDLPVYVPLSSSILSDWASWLWGNPPEVR